MWVEHKDPVAAPQPLPTPRHFSAVGRALQLGRCQGTTLFKKETTCRRDAGRRAAGTCDMPRAARRCRLEAEPWLSPTSLCDLVKKRPRGHKLGNGGLRHHGEQIAHETG
eukprot:4735689-Alexandrium_andersonii.AAC.1